MVDVRRVSIDDIEIALDATLRAVEDDRVRRFEKVRYAPIAEFLQQAKPTDRPAAEPDLHEVEMIARDPVGTACRLQLIELGRMLFRVTGSTREMRFCMSRMAAAAPRWQTSRTEIIERCWIGIGNDHDMWAA